MGWSKYSVSFFGLVVALSFARVLETRVRLAHKCVSSFPEDTNKLPVIMLHGLSDRKETWDGTYPSVNFLTGRRVCIYDARNHGDSEWSDTFSVDVLADDLGNFMADMKIERASLVGHSMGGLTVMKFALKHPEKVESLFVEDIAPNSVTKEIRDQIRALLTTLLESLSVIPIDADQETAKKAVIDHIAKALGNQFPRDIFENHQLRCQNGVWKWKANFEVFVKVLEKEGDLVGKFEGRYDGRAFFIYGTDSPFKVIEQEEGIRELFPKAELFGVEGADHLVHFNHTIYLNKLVLFLKDVS